MYLWWKLQVRNSWPNGAGWGQSEFCVRIADENSLMYLISVPKISITCEGYPPHDVFGKATVMDTFSQGLHKCEVVQ